MPPHPSRPPPRSNFTEVGWGRKQTATLPASIPPKGSSAAKAKEEEEDRGKKKKGPLFPLVVLARTTAAAFLAGLAEAEESHARTERGGRL